MLLAVNCGEKKGVETFLYSRMTVLMKLGGKTKATCKVFEDERDNSYKVSFDLTGASKVAL